jgi:hypothetical protein
MEGSRMYLLKILTYHYIQLKHDVNDETGQFD